MGVPLNHPLSYIYNYIYIEFSIANRKPSILGNPIYGNLWSMLLVSPEPRSLSEARANQLTSPASPLPKGAPGPFYAEANEGPNIKHHDGHGSKSWTHKTSKEVS
jgi:hypothetical protein